MKNFVFQNKDEYDIFTIQQLDKWFEVPNDSNDNDNTSSLILMFQSDAYESSYEIKYMSLDEIISNYGGTTGVFYSVFTLIMGFFVTPFYNSSLINEAYNFHENNMNDFEVKEFMDSFKHVYNFDKDNENDNVYKKTANKLSK